LTLADVVVTTIRAVIGDSFAVLLVAAIWVLRTTWLQPGVGVDVIRLSTHPLYASSLIATFLFGAWLNVKIIP
jgi:hypothetical protein